MGKVRDLIEEGGSTVAMETRALRVERTGTRIDRVIVQQGDRVSAVTGDHFVSSMPVSALVRRLDPPAPKAVLAAANGLKYRDFLIVPIVVNLKSLFPDNWIYIHSPEFRVGRIQNFKNWSAAMVPDLEKTCLGMEYFCSEGDDIWERSDEELDSSGD